MTTSIPTNAERAQWARNALAVFTAETYSGDHPDTMDAGDLESAISDLICDLLLGAYVVLLAQAQQRVVERETKVRYLPNRSARPEPALLLRRSGS